MYTVVRFLAGPECRESPEVLGQRLNAKRAGLFAGMDVVKDRFSSNVALDGDWRAHRDAIIAFLDDLGPELSHAQAAGFLMGFDVAIAPEDCGKAPVVCIEVDTQLIKRLAAYGMVIEFSLYCLGRQPEVAEDPGPEGP